MSKYSEDQLRDAMRKGYPIIFSAYSKSEDKTTYSCIRRVSHYIKKDGTEGLEVELLDKNRHSIAIASVEQITIPDIDEK